MPSGEGSPVLVEAVVSTDLVVVDLGASLQTAAAEMLAAGVGSVVVLEGDAPTGIVTESDALAAGHAADVPFSEIPVKTVMSTPLVTVQPDRTVRAATERMREEGVKKLVVADGLDVVGILTATDLVGSYPELKAEIRAQLDRELEHFEDG